MPSTGLYFFYLCSNTPRPGGLIDQLEAALECKVVAVDTKIGGAKHDLSSSSLLRTILHAAASPRCLGAFASPDCATWSAAHFLPDAQGKPGKPKRNIDHTLGFHGPDGALPRDVYIANTVAIHVAHVFGTLHACGKPALAETPACRRPKTTDSLVGCELHTYMYDLPAWVELRYAGPSRIFVRTEGPPLPLRVFGRRGTRWPRIRALGSRR